MNASLNTAKTTANNRAVQDIYPLSPTQQGLLFHSLYGDRQAGSYVVQISYILNGELNHQAFEQAWQRLVQRHTILRTAFVWESLETPVQVVGQQATLPIHWHNWEAFSAAVQADEFLDLLRRDRTQGFHLSKAPLMRVQVIQLGANRYQVLWTHHHILLDGWSLPILLKEWIACYQTVCNQGTDQHQASLLNQTGLPYRDYIAWLQKQDIEAAKQFWKSRLAGIHAPTSLGIDQLKIDQLRIDPLSRGTLPSSSLSFNAKSYALSASLTERIKSFARQHRLTLSTIVQGAWAKLLSVYSGDAEVIYGLACAGRPDSLPAAERRVGLFINTLPMRVKVTAEGSLTGDGNGNKVAAWLWHVQNQQLEQQPYEYTPLVDIQAVSDIPRQSPLFESVVVFENYPLESAQGIAGLALSDVSISEQTHYPLTLYATVGETLSFKLLYDAQRFSERSISRLFGHFQAVMLGIVKSNQKRELTECFSILSEVEKQQLLSFGQGSVAAQPERMVLEVVSDVIAQQAEQTPTAVALTYVLESSADESLTYHQLNVRANQLEHNLRKQANLSESTRVGICSDRSVDMVIALLAILKSGCAYVPLDPHFPYARLDYAVEDADIRWLICHDATSHVFENIGQNQLQQINVSQVANEISTQPTFNPEITVEADSLAYLIYTSGSTGQPKGVPITHKNLSNLLQAMANRLQVSKADTLMAVTTLAFDIAALELFLPLISGARLLLTSQESTRNAQQLAAYLNSYDVSIMQATPATWRLLLSNVQLSNIQLSNIQDRQNNLRQSLKNLRILCGGEALDVALAQQLLSYGKDVWNVYGPTETTVWSGALTLSSESLADGTVPIGQPIDNTQFYVLDEQQQLVPIGVTGELYIGGMGLSQGYRQRPELTAEKFVDVDVLGDRIRLYRTGDRVRYREDGTLDYLGRLDYQAKLRGYRIELGDIEAAIARHPQVNQSVVLLQGERAETKTLVAYVILANAGNEPKESGAEHVEEIAEEMSEEISQTLRSHLAIYLPHYMIPTAYQVIESFPLTPNGKVDRKALPAVSNPVSTTAALPANEPQTNLEKTLAEIWQSILPNISSMSIHDNFFEVGGHSLLVVTAQSKIRQQLNVELSMVDLFRYPTLSTLAAHIRRVRRSKETASQKVSNSQGNQSESQSETVATGKQRLRKRLQQRQASKPSLSNPSLSKPIGVEAL